MIITKRKILNKQPKFNACLFAEKKFGKRGKEKWTRKI